MEIKDYTSKLKEFLQCKNDIPPEIVSSFDFSYKVKKSWFMNVICYVEFGINEGFLKGRIAEEYNKLLEYLNSTKFSCRLTIKEDIEKADMLLSEAVSNLEEKIK